MKKQLELSSKRNLVPDTFDRNTYETPEWLFKAFDREFGFAWDLCATEETAKCSRFISPKEDSLSVDWHKLEGGWLWINPPYSPLKPWIQKAQMEAQKGAKIVALVPPVLCTQYLMDYLPDGIVFIVGRVSFLAEKKEIKGNRDDSCLLCWNGEKVRNEYHSPEVIWVKRDDLLLHGPKQTS